VARPRKEVGAATARRGRIGARRLDHIQGQASHVSACAQRITAPVAPGLAAISGPVDTLGRARVSQAGIASIGDNAMRRRGGEGVAALPPGAATVGSVDFTRRVADERRGPERSLGSSSEVCRYCATAEHAEGASIYGWRSNAPMSQEAPCGRLTPR